MYIELLYAKKRLFFYGNRVWLLPYTDTVAATQHFAALKADVTF